MSNLIFKPFSDFSPGLIFDLLTQSYAPMPELVGLKKNSWKSYDQSVFANLDKGVGQSGFVSCIDRNVVGFASWDPRQKPIAIIGHNCVLPLYRRRGYGKEQIQELLQRLIDLGFRSVKVTTGGGSFCLPARKMYTSCGFVETSRCMHDDIPDLEIVNYARKID